MLQESAKYAVIGGLIALVVGVFGAQVALALPAPATAAVVLVISVVGLLVAGSSPGRISPLAVCSLMLLLLSGSCLVITGLSAVGSFIGSLIQSVVGPVPVPLLVLGAILGLLAAAWALSAPARRRKEWQAAGCCGWCGYDLRESPDVCPECGRPVPEDAVRRQRILMASDRLRSPETRARFLAASGTAEPQPPSPEALAALGIPLSALRSSRSEQPPPAEIDPTIALSELRHRSPPPDLSPLPLDEPDPPPPQKT
jgi:hypothetical protein